jgi:hypothetical protein
VRRFDLPFGSSPPLPFFDDNHSPKMAEPHQVRASAEKHAPSHHEEFKQDAHYAAERGHAATDRYVLYRFLVSS